MLTAQFHLEGKVSSYQFKRLELMSVSGITYARFAMLDILINKTRPLKERLESDLKTSKGMASAKELILHAPIALTDSKFNVYQIIELFKKGQEYKSVGIDCVKFLAPLLNSEQSSTLAQRLLKIISNDTNIWSTKIAIYTALSPLIEHLDEKTLNLWLAHSLKNPVTNDQNLWCGYLESCKPLYQSLSKEQKSKFIALLVRNNPNQFRNQETTSNISPQCTVDDGIHQTIFELISSLEEDNTRKANYVLLEILIPLLKNNFMPPLKRLLSIKHPLDYIESREATLSSLVKRLPKSQYTLLKNYYLGNKKLLPFNAFLFVAYLPSDLLFRLCDHFIDKIYETPNNIVFYSYLIGQCHPHLDNTQKNVIFMRILGYLEKIAVRNIVDDISPVLNLFFPNLGILQIVKYEFMLHLMDNPNIKNQEYAIKNISGCWQQMSKKNHQEIFPRLHLFAAHPNPLLRKASNDAFQNIILLLSSEELETLHNKLHPNDKVEDSIFDINPASAIVPSFEQLAICSRPNTNRPELSAVATVTTSHPKIMPK